MPTSASRRSATNTTIFGFKPKSSAKSKTSQGQSAGGKSLHQTQTSKKRKVDETSWNKSASSGVGTASKKSSNNNKKQKTEQKEKRLRVYRSKAPASFLQKLDRAQNQRMVVIGRSRSESGGHLQEDIDIVGSTGNIYRVTIGRLPECTCPDHQKGNECKHKVYALSTVLKAPYELQYQRALLTTEVEEIFAKAPPIPTETGDSSDKDGKRKPIEGDCPICYMELEPKSQLVWCKAACGNNMHKECFDLWAASQRGSEVRCVYCRTPWQMEKQDVEAIKKAGQQNEEGYINVAEQFGISRVRDYSSYYQPWARRNFGYG